MLIEVSCIVYCKIDEGIHDILLQDNQTGGMKQWTVPQGKGEFEYVPKKRTLNTIDFAKNY